MEKVLITLFVPSINEKYDVLLPVFLKVCDIIPLLTEALEELTQKRYVSSGAEILCSCERNIILDMTYTINESGIQHGDKLYIF